MKQPIVLIVDDKPANLEMLLIILQQADYKVLAAKSGSKALQHVSHLLPDIILLDVMMPEMDGFAVCRRLKANPETQHIPIIFTTALDDTANKVRGFEVGGVDYITKPINETELLARLETHLTLRQLHTALQQQARQLEQDVQQRTAELQAEIARREAQQQEQQHLYNLVKQQSKGLRSLTHAFVETQQQKQQTLAHNLDQHVLQNLELLATNLSLIDNLSENQNGSNSAFSVIATHARSSLELVKQIQEQVETTTAKLNTPSSVQNNPFLLLSEREQQVLKQVVAGKTSYEIAASLSISHNTVRTYRSRIMQKLEVSNISALMKLVLQHDFDSGS